MTSVETAIALKKDLDVLRPISKADELRIMQKFRLDWNFHSNNLEGNSLTYGETKALILFGLTAQGRPFKDSLEMRGHDEAIKWIEEIIKEERPLTENFIRQLHELILKEDYEVDAITPDGKPTKKWVRIGTYKTEPNHVLTKTGEIFRFATPEETPAKMHDLIEWYRTKKQQDINPILIAAEFHYRFIRIHPFDDGNGRTARILMNFILMQFGYPPVIIKTQDKENYFAALRQADAGMIGPFIEYIASNLVRSLEIMIKGAKGEDIEEPNDLDKEISLLKMRLESAGKKIDIKKNKEVITDFYNRSIIPLFRKFILTSNKFDAFYLEKEYSLYENNGGYGGLDEDELITQIRNRINDKTVTIHMRYFFKSINIADLEGFYFDSEIRIDFAFSNFKVFSNNATDITFTRSYGEQLTEKEMDELVRGETKRHKEIIEQKIEELQQKGNDTNQ
ncbi:MAG: Fic family protein [Cyclobacteriaceae bacterium]